MYTQHCIATNKFIHMIDSQLNTYYLRPNMIFLFDRMFRIKAKNNILKTKLALLVSKKIWVEEPFSNWNFEILKSEIFGAFSKSTSGHLIV